MTEAGNPKQGPSMAGDIAVSFHSVEPVCATNVKTETVVVDHGSGASVSHAIGETPSELGLQQKCTDEELQTFILSIAHEIVIRRMSVPAVFALELMKPLSFIGASSLVFMGPILETLIDPKKIEKMTCVLEDRNKVEALLVAIETLEKQS